MSLDKVPRALTSETNLNFRGDGLLQFDAETRQEL